MLVLSKGDLFTTRASKQTKRSVNKSLHKLFNNNKTTLKCLNISVFGDAIKMNFPIELLHELKILALDLEGDYWPNDFLPGRLISQKLDSLLLQNQSYADLLARGQIPSKLLYLKEKYEAGFENGLLNGAFQNLRSLSVIFSHGDNPQTVIRALPEKCPYLEHLNLISWSEHTNIGDMESLAELNNLRSLILSIYQNIIEPTATMETLDKIFSKGRLRRFRFASSQSTLSLDVVRTIVEKCPGITQIDIEDCILNGDLEAFASDIERIVEGAYQRAGKNVSPIPHGEIGQKSDDNFGGGAGALEDRHVSIHSLKIHSNDERYQQYFRNRPTNKSYLVNFNSGRMSVPEIYWGEAIDPNEFREESLDFWLKKFDQMRKK